jgi:DNA-binding CsgD family transcriptional regulator
MATPRSLDNSNESAGEPGGVAAAPFELEGLTCHVVCVDDIMPTHHAAQGNGRIRLSYCRNEIVHFELGAHRYALVAEPPVRLERETQCGTPGDIPIEDVHSRLTNRELQIVQLICMGLLTKQVADRLRISEFTVRSYLKTIYCKLGVRSRGAMVYAYSQTLARGALGSR